LSLQFFGEKEYNQPNRAASASERDFYWKYESYLKKERCEWNTLVGSAGELVAIRKQFIFEAPEEDTIRRWICDGRVRLAAQGFEWLRNLKRSLLRRVLPMWRKRRNPGKDPNLGRGNSSDKSDLPELMNWLKTTSLTFQYIHTSAGRWTLIASCLIIAMISR